MTTTPTRWSNEITVSADTGLFEPQVTALADDSFIIGWENSADIFGRNLDAFGSFTGGNFLAALSNSIFIPLSGPQFVQQTNGQVVVEYRETFTNGTTGDPDHDVTWHLADPNADPVNESPIEGSVADAFLHDATATAGGGSAVVFEFPGDGTPVQVLQFIGANGVPTSNLIGIGSQTHAQLNPAIAGIFNGNVAVVTENFFAATSDRDIRLHIFTPTGQDIASGLNGSHEVLVSGGGHNAAFPDVVLTNGGTPDIPGDGSIVVVWQDNNGIEYRRFGDDTGSPIDVDPRMIAGTAGSLLPHVAALNDGGFIVEWGQAFGQEQDGSPDFDLVLQRFDINGNAVGDKVFIANPGDQGPFNVSLTTLADGRVVVLFNNETGDSTNLTTLDYVILDPRNQTIDGTNENDTIVGRLDASTINGLGGNDTLTGMNANDVLSGGAGTDSLTGGLGKDMFFGGSDADTFHFASLKDSKVKSPDVIVDFKHSQGDKIDLADIDANTRHMGDQAFHFIGTHGFNHRAGELHFVKGHGHLLVEGDVNGDGRADFRIDVHGAGSLTSHDFDL